MNPQEHLYTIFQSHIETTMNCGETLLTNITEASQMMVSSLIAGGKIFTCGNGTSAALAKILSNHLVNRFERERPSLPAITLGASLTSVTATAYEQSYNDIYSREVRALASENDILVVFTSSGNPLNLVQAIQAAHEREAQIIAFSGRDGGNVASLLDANDKELRVPSHSGTRIHEMHLLMLFCICDLIDEQLFGPAEA